MKHTFIYYILTFIILALAADGCAPKSQAGSSPTVTSAESTKLIEAHAWADSVMGTLTMHQRVAQLFVPRIDAYDNPEGVAMLKRAVTQQEIGGFLLGKGTVEGYTRLINSAQEVAKVPLLVTLDGEWGLNMRVSDAPRFPYNMGLGAITDPKLLYDYGREVGRECRAVGINVDFAPVLDVNSNPANPVIGYRSFGEDPARVAELGVAFAKGMESEGVLSVAKHFPGHGDTNADSHKTLPQVTHGLSMLESVDLVPFTRYIEAGLGGIMVGHLNVPALDGSGTPASMSKRITTDMLKKRMGFKGLVFTDALAMKGAVSGHNNASVQALLAGADVLLAPTSVATDIKAVEKALEKGVLKESAINERCHKLLTYKYLLGLADFRPANPEKVKKEVCSPQAQAIIDRLADASVTVLNNSNALLPVRDLGKRRVAVVLIGEKAGCTFATYCKKYAPCSVTAVNGGNLTAAQMAKLREADVVVAGVFTDAAWARTAFASLTDMERLVPVFFVNPYKMGKFTPALKRLPTLVTVYDNIPSLQRAGAEAVFGGIDITGRFPVNVNSVATMGTGVDVPKVRLGYSSPPAEGMKANLEEQIDSIAQACIKARAFSGCQVLVAYKGQVVIDKAYGHTDFSSRAAPVTTETLFDLASVTKTNATLAGLMKAYDEGLFELGDKISEYIPQLDSTAKADITIRDLLFHESGMPPVFNIYKFALDNNSYDGSLISSEPTADNSVKMGKNEYGNAKARLRTDIYSDTPDDQFAYPVARDIYVSQEGIDKVMNTIHNISLRSKTYRYSCLNFMLLKEIQENMTGVDLDQWIDTEIYGPLGAWHTMYLPLSQFDTDHIAATEKDKMLRRQHIHGYVHDELAAFSGGVSGNAGLFSTAGDVAKLCQMWLSGGAYGGDRILGEETVRIFTTQKSPSGRRGLGFDLLRFNRGMDSQRASTSTYGHTGFTGTCYWIDPEHNLIYVFLSNRVNPSRDNPAWSRMNPRGTILRKVYQSLP